MQTLMAKSSMRGVAVRSAVQNGAKTTMSAARPNWFPGTDFPKHLENSNLPANFGFDPLGLGASDRLAYYAESERVHARWAMLGVAGILAQEIVHPESFWYTSGAELKTDIPLPGLLAFELFAMHFVEVKRGRDLEKPGSQDQDPIFGNNKLPPHDVGYPGGIFSPFVPGNLEELKVKELKNGRLAMLAFVGFTMAAQVWGVNPLAALSIHLDAPLSNNIFGIAASSPIDFHAPTCKIPETVTVQGITLKAGCFLQGLWP